MNMTQIRNATQLITYAGKRLLIDPMLAPKGAYPGFPGTARADIRNPMVELPIDVQTLLDAGSLPIESVAEQVGFLSAVTYRQQFKARFGVSPAEWRKTFGSRL
ncbi:hypothetical protein DP185_07820 [Enterobacter hormaechei]|nr:hypothetical protein DP185_07820 [Enterobacter hormaechei]